MTFFFNVIALLHKGDPISWESTTFIAQKAAHKEMNIISTLHEQQFLNNYSDNVLSMM